MGEDRHHTVPGHWQVLGTDYMHQECMSVAAEKRVGACVRASGAYATATTQEPAHKPRVHPTPRG